MDSKYLGRIPFSLALTHEQDAFATVRATASPGVLLGFETDPVVTCGVRAGVDDLIFSPEALRSRGFSICEVDRGGQATIHNPGQLVIFPIVKMRVLGARAWIKLLAQVTAECLRGFGVDSEWRESHPGLYTSRGKIMACGVRIRQGISTHGIAINVCNNLEDFARIRACGVVGAAIDRMGEDFQPADVFKVWCDKFRHTQG